VALFLPDGKTLLTGDNDLFQSWDHKTGKATDWKEKASRGIGPAAALDAKGTMLVSASPSGRVVTVWDVKEGKLTRTLENGSNVAALALSPNGWKLAGAGPAKLRMWDLSKGRLLDDGKDEYPGGTIAVAF